MTDLRLQTLPRGAQGIYYSQAVEERLVLAAWPVTMSGRYVDALVKLTYKDQPLPGTWWRRMGPDVGPCPAFELVSPSNVPAWLREHAAFGYIDERVEAVLHDDEALVALLEKLDTLSAQEYVSREERARRRAIEVAKLYQGEAVRVQQRQDYTWVVEVDDGFRLRYEDGQWCLLAYSSRFSCWFSGASIHNYDGTLPSRARLDERVRDKRREEAMCAATRPGG